MSKETLIKRLQTSLPDVADKIKGLEVQLLNTALNHLDKLRPKIKSTPLEIFESVNTYDPPTGIIGVVELIWRESYHAKSWESGFIDVWPEAFFIDQKITLSPKPTRAQIDAVGSTATLHYHTKRALDLLTDFEADLVIIRAMAESMRLESIRKSGKPLQMRDGQSSSPKNANPASLYQAFLDEFEAGCRG